MDPTSKIQPLELTHSDISERVELTSLRNEKQFVFFLEFYTEMGAVYYLKDKSKVLNILK